LEIVAVISLWLFVTGCGQEPPLALSQNRSADRPVLNPSPPLFRQITAQNMGAGSVCQHDWED
jgi:hypothetical protein